MGLLVLTPWTARVARPSELTPQAYLPLVSSEQRPYEVRGLWVTRFDWTFSGQQAQPEVLDEIVQNAAAAGFNIILFQVRGTADAFYTPGLEPWSQRLNSDGELGKDPGWDPLAYMIERAHAAGLQLHAYINVYPTWSGTTPPLDVQEPPHPFWTWSEWPGTGWADWRQWDDQHQPMNLNPGYLHASPGAPPVVEHIVSVAQDIAGRYSIDGLHLDYIRYAGSAYSCDPFSESEAGTACFGPGWEDWQRERVNALVQDVYQALPPGLMLSAAVWPVYRDFWGWGVSEGYSDYYQDSKAWIGGGYLDAMLPMIYPSSYGACDPEQQFCWTQEVWQTLATDFQASRNGRFVVPGIGAGYSDFGEIEARISAARSIGTAGHALFSYSGLLAHGYFDDLANGPYAQPAAVPPMTW